MDFLSNFLAVAEKVGLLFLIILLGFICQRKKILTEQANRIAEMDTVTKDDLMTITAADVKTALYGDAQEDGKDPEENKK